MADEIPLTDEEKKAKQEEELLRAASRWTKRAKHQFGFELSDNNYPYEVQTSGQGRNKLAVFNYSAEYFRRKKSSNAGLNSIAGGNIPSDMATEATFGSPHANPDGSSPKPIVCALNKGKGTKIKPYKILNLSPNDIQPYPCQCGLNPEWTENGCDGKLADPAYFIKYGGRCVKFNPPLPGSNEPIMVGITKAGSVDCPVDTSWTFEAGERHKPNFMYLPAHQSSCSKHPRAQGFANEDNYDCLKKNLMNSGGVNPNDRTEGFQQTQAPCCDTFGNCMIYNLTLFVATQRSTIYTGTPEVKDPKTGLPYQIGEYIKYGPPFFMPICHDVMGNGASDFMGFSCNTLLNPPESKTSGFPLSAEMLKLECDSSKVGDTWVSGKKCDFGWLKRFNPNPSLCPAKPELSEVKAQLGDLADDYDDIMQYVQRYPSWFTRTYHAEGNTDCACTAKGWVTVAGHKDCVHCSYMVVLPPKPPSGPTPPGGIIPPPTTGPGGGFIYKGVNTEKCTEHTAGPKAICSCIWNDEVEVPDLGTYDNKLYVSTLSFPSYKFGNGTKLEIGDNGEVRDVGCGQEVILNCNDIS